MPCTFRINNDNELESLDSNNINNMLWGQLFYSSGPVRAISFLTFNGIAACRPGRVPLEKKSRSAFVVNFCWLHDFV